MAENYPVPSNLPVLHARRGIVDYRKENIQKQLCKIYQQPVVCVNKIRDNHHKECIKDKEEKETIINFDTVA